MSIYDFQVTSINGKLVELSAYRGKVLAAILVNSLVFKSFTKVTMSRGLKYLGFLVTNSTRKSQGTTRKCGNIVRATLE